MLAITCCIAFIIVDCYYAAKNIILDAYLWDALVELVFLILYMGGIFLLVKHSNKETIELLKN